MNGTQGQRVQLAEISSHLTRKMRHCNDIPHPLHAYLYFFQSAAAGLPLIATNVGIARQISA